MLNFFRALLLLSWAPLQSGAPSDAPSRITVKPEVAAARVAACGFTSARPKFDDSLQEDVVEVSDVTSASTERLRCAATASLDTSYYVVFPPPLYEAYEKLYWPMSREREIAEAKAWLDKRGLLAHLPTYDPKRDNDAAFVRTLETLCGPKAIGTLRPMHGSATFKEEALGTFNEHGFLPGKLDEGTMWCLLNAATASNYPIVFIGNGASEQRP